MRKNKRLIIAIAVLLLLPTIAMTAVSCDDIRSPQLETDTPIDDVIDTPTDGGTEDDSTTDEVTTDSENETTTGPGGDLPIEDDTTTDGGNGGNEDSTTTGGNNNSGEDTTTTGGNNGGEDSTTTGGTDPEPTEKTYVWIITTSVYIRAGVPLKDNAILGAGVKGDKFEVLERADTYTKILYNGQVAYTSANPDYVSFTEPEPEPEPTSKTYLWVIADNLNIRDSSLLAEGGNVVGTAHIGDKFEVLERADTYTKIVYNGGVAYTSAKPENVLFTDDTSVTNLEVIRKIIYAVETGGQVYGNADYDSFIEAGHNTSNEVAITIGAAQWYGEKAKGLLNLIRSTDPTLFAQLDTAGIANDLDTADWSTYAISKTSAKALCIINIINSDVGRACQDKLVDLQMLQYMNEAKALGVTDEAALMMCANIRHQGGNSALKRVIGKTATPYTLDNIYAALQTDTGNQVGAYTSRQKMVYESLKKYL